MSKKNKVFKWVKSLKRKIREFLAQLFTEKASASNKKGTAAHSNNDEAQVNEAYYQTLGLK